jgi:hypothetical protein
VVALLLGSSAARAGATVEIMPTVGTGKPTGQGSDDYGLGFGFGLSAGARFGSAWSLHGQFDYEFLNPNNRYGSVSAEMIRLQIAPAYHFIERAMDFSIGPTAGIFLIDASGTSYVGGGTSSASARGVQLGLAMTLMFAINPKAAVGPYLSYDRLWATSDCIGDGADERCQTPDNHDDGFISAGLGLRF